MSLPYNASNSYLFVKGKKSLNLKLIINSNFPTQFCLESISNGSSNTGSREVSVNGNIYDFSVNCSSVDKSEI